MNSKWWLALLALGGVIAWFVYDANRSDPLQQQARDLQRAQQRLTETARPEGMPPSSDFLVRKIEPENFWFVGKHEDGAGVEIPFRPGEKPRMTDDRTPKHDNPGFVGPDQCKDCHPENYNSFLSTAHYNTSRVVTEETIDGNFQAGQNVFQSADPNLRFEMVRCGDDEFCQQVQFFDWQFEVPMEIIVGSSRMAQTYLYWHGDRLFQHNVTHLTEGDQWINSPGYIDGDAAYARPIPQRCLDCHMTYFDFRRPPNHYTPGTFIHGVTCERCHGPAESHVEYHRQHPDADQAVAIVNPKKLDRQTQMEVCGQCHGGSRALKDTALSFRPGDRLSDHYHPANDQLDAKNSVHTSNQLARLSQSRCFEQSEMTCIDCHDPHQNEHGQSQLFSQRCMACHQSENDCGFHPHEGIDFADNCVDCHMPKRPTERLRLKSVQGDVFPPLRDHLIRVDEQATEAFLQQQQ